MKTRAALIACSVSMVGPWIRSRGNESGIQIVHMVKGEHISVEIEVGDLKDMAIFDSPGMFPLPWKNIEKYRVNKHVKDDIVPSPTTVEIVLNG